MSLSTGFPLRRSDCDGRAGRHLAGDCLWCFVVVNVDAPDKLSLEIENGARKCGLA